MSSSLWLVARRRSGFAVLPNPRTVVHGGGDAVSLDSSSRVSALGIGLLGAQYVPKSRSQQGVVRFETGNDSEFIARNSAFYRPKLALIGQLHIT